MTNKAEKIIFRAEKNIVLLAHHTNCDEKILKWECSFCGEDWVYGIVVEIANVEYIDIGDYVIVSGSIVELREFEA